MIQLTEEHNEHFRMKPIVLSGEDAEQFLDELEKPTMPTEEQKQFFREVMAYAETEKINQTFAQALAYIEKDSFSDEQLEALKNTLNQKE